MTPIKASLLTVLFILATAAIGGVVLIRRGFRATSEPSGLERLVARSVRNLAIPRTAQRGTNPLKASAENLQAGRELFLKQCANCHGVDGGSKTPMGRNLYPRVPDLHSPETQGLSDGAIYYIIANGVQLTGMPAWGSPHQPPEKIWQLVLFVRSLRPLSPT